MPSQLTGTESMAPGLVSSQLQMFFNLAASGPSLEHCKHRAKQPLNMGPPSFPVPACRGFTLRPSGWEAAEPSGLSPGPLRVPPKLAASGSSSHCEAQPRAHLLSRIFTCSGVSISICTASAGTRDREAAGCSPTSPGTGSESSVEGKLFLMSSTSSSNCTELSQSSAGKGAGRGARPLPVLSTPPDTWHSPQRRCSGEH